MICGMILQVMRVGPKVGRAQGCYGEDYNVSGELVAMGWDLLCKVALGRLSMILDIVRTIIEASNFVYGDYLALWM
jgi:hypothetical protein